MLSQLSKERKIYSIILYASAAILLGYLIIAEWRMLLVGVLLFIALSFLAEQLTVSLAGDGFASVGSAVTFASLLLFGPLAAAFTDVIACLKWQDLKERRPLHIIAFNASQFVISAGIAGLVYIYTGGIILTQVGRGFTSKDFPSIILPFLLSAATYLLLNTALVSIDIGLEKKTSPLGTWLVNAQGTIGSYLALAVFGVVTAHIYMIAGPASIILLIAPLMIAREVFNRYIKLKELYGSSVKSLVKAIELKDPYTSGHSDRVSDLSENIARELGWRENKIENLKWAGYLHDIGKIGVPKKILNKPDELSKAEYDKVKEHTSLGVSILEEIEFLKGIKESILYHHEHIDAKGYPEGLTGDYIPEASKILAVADAYDAMTSERAYRPAMTKEKALSELKRCSDTQFDKKLVNAFLEVIEKKEEVTA